MIELYPVSGIFAENNLNTCSLAGINPVPAREPAFEVWDGKFFWKPRTPSSLRNAGVLKFPQVLAYLRA